jgi:nucleoside triphosphate pyrophosphatase
MTEPTDPRRSPRKLILASASPRRKELLEAAGFSFEVMPTSVEERQRENEPAEEFVSRIAAAKAEAVLLRLSAGSNAVILAADTVVVVDSTTLGKPASAEDARRMLRLLSGRKHLVLTGVCVMDYANAGEAAGRLIRKESRICSTVATFSPLSDAQINGYVSTGEPFDKAGAYAIQGGASKFVERIEGCYTNVVGLPISMVCQMLSALEIPATTKKLAFPS